jgi:pentalenic acid synthase
MTETVLTPQTGDAPAFPNQRTCPYQLPEGYTKLRDAEEPLRRVTLYDGRQAWVVTKHEVARKLLIDPRLSADRAREDFPHTSGRGVGFSQRRRPFIILDPPEHGPKRRMMLSQFTVKHVKEMRGDIERTVHEVIDDMLASGPSADLVTQFSLPVPSLAICRLLGVPYADHDFFQAISARLALDVTPAEALVARDELAGYIDGLITKLEAEPGPGLLNTLITERLAKGEIDREELISDAILLLFAGHETTASMASLAVITLLEHPDQLAALQADPSLVPGAVEELLRYLSIADLVGSRIATADIEIGGQVIRAGDGVMIPSSIANRDGSVWADPDTLDVRRGGRHHIAFGYGVHQCLGQNLARLELEVMITMLFERIPTLRLAVPVDQLTLRPAINIQGVSELPVTW